MRYLRKFNEDKEYITLETLQELVDNYLSYLKDSYFTINIDYSKYKEEDVIFYIDVVKFNRFRLEFKWSEISEDLIQFYQVLENTYDISSEIILYDYKENLDTRFGITKVVSIDEILNGEITDDSLLKCIKIKIDKGVDNGIFNNRS